MMNLERAVGTLVRLRTEVLDNPALLELVDAALGYLEPDNDIVFPVICANVCPTCGVAMPDNSIHFVSEDGSCYLVTNIGVEE